MSVTAPFDLATWLNQICAAAIRDLPDFNVWQHAQAEIFLDGHTSLTPRYFDPALTPYTKLFQEAATHQYTHIPEADWWLRDLLARGQRVDEIFALKSSQSGFTQAALNIIIFLTRYLTGRGLYCIDSRDKAGKLCRLRLLPQLQRLCHAHLTPDQDDLGTYWIELTNWVWEMVGSYSSGVFSEKPLTHAFLDDVEYMVTEGGHRGILDGVWIGDHARSRFTTAEQHLLAVFSKPDDADSQFIAEHKAGSQHEWHWPCPHCNHRFTPELKHLNFTHPGCKDLAGYHDLDAVEALTTLRCPKCDKDIEETPWKTRMNEQGHYLPKPKDQRHLDGDPLLQPRRLSLRINDLASPFKEVRWGKLATLIIGAKNNPAKLKFLHTNHGATPWKEHAINLRAEHIRALIAGTVNDQGHTHGTRAKIPPYSRGQVPFLPIAITATADRQGDKLKWTLFAWQLDGTCALIEYGATLAEQELIDLTENPRAHHGGPILCLPDPARRMHAGLGLEQGGCLIDSGFETYDVYDFCHASGWRWYPSKGVPGLSPGGYLVEGKRDFKDGKEILRYHYHDFQLKVAFYKGMIELHSHPDHTRRRPSKLHLPTDLDEDFILELTAESLVPDPKTKKMTWRHDKTIGPNDYGDACKMQLALWQIIGPLLQQAHPPQPPRPPVT